MLPERLPSVPGITPWVLSGESGCDGFGPGVDVAPDREGVPCSCIGIWWTTPWIVGMAKDSDDGLTVCPGGGTDWAAFVDTPFTLC